MGNFSVQVRSNVCLGETEDMCELIPGDVAEEYGMRIELNEKQKKEKMYYALCSICKRTRFQIREEGCDECAENGYGTLTVAEAKARKEKRDRTCKSF